MRGPFSGGVDTSRICCCCCSGSRSIARSPSCCCCSPPRSCCCSAPIKPHFSRLNRLLGQSIFRGWWVGGSPELRKNHPQRGGGLTGEVPHYLSQGSGWGAGGLEGWPGRRWRVVSGRRGGARAASSAGGGWRLRRVQVEDELQALPKLHVKCLSATMAFSFDSSIQIPQ